MGSITNLLKKHRVVALDTCLWIYHFEQHPQYSKLVEQILTAIAKGQCKATASELVLLELMTGPLKLGRQDVADEYETLLTHFPNLEFIPITRNILLEAAKIRALHGFRTPDAIILATAKEQNATLVITNDQNWSRYPELTTLCLAEIA
jgi:predicted nucleic acid-binding protein